LQILHGLENASPEKDPFILAGKNPSRKMLHGEIHHSGSSARFQPVGRGSKVEGGKS
jgi:hypothetical protein